MTITIDPDGVETRALARATTWRGKQVIEIGCGHGRLTQRLASLGASEVYALDPDAKLIHAARNTVPKRYARQIQFRVGNAERLWFPSNRFDLAVFSWVL